ncbi:MAG TPA: U32 family peptidase, partial [Thauera sp.]|nr:U32 family peptidase [Thauera sp.]
REAAIKIAGREAPTARKLASVRMVRSVLERVRAGEDDAAVRAFAVGLRPSESHCATGYMCYYPEVLCAEGR